MIIYHMLTTITWRNRALHGWLISMALDDAGWDHTRAVMR